MLRGSAVALVTPMSPDGHIDFSCLRRLVDWHVDQGTDAIVAAGTTGESSTLSFDEHIEVIRVIVEQTAGRIPVVAGTGSNSTHEAIHLSQCAKAAGADYGISITPYYNKPTQEGIYQHFKSISEAVDLPTLLYNVPGRTVADMDNKTVLRLSALPGIVGIKDATGDLKRVVELLHHLPAGFGLYSGDDATTLAFMLLGGHGAISVTANVAPHMMHDLFERIRLGEINQACAINARLHRLHVDLFLESNPIPVKWALHQLGLIPEGIRLPLTTLSQDKHRIVQQALSQAGLL